MINENASEVQTFVRGTVDEVRKFTRDTIWTFSGLGFQSVVGLVTVAFLTKSFPAELYGVWAQISVTTALLAPILTLKLDSAYIRFLSGQQNREKIRQSLGIVIWPVFSIGFLLLVISWILRESLSAAIFVDSRYMPFVSLTFLWTAVRALFGLSLCYYKALRRIRRVAVMQIGCSLLQTAILAILIINGFDLIWVVFSNIIIQGLFVILVLGLIFLETGVPTLHIRGLKEYVLFSIPILPSALLFWTMNSSSRYIITHLLGLSYAGIYSVSWSLVNLISFFITPVAANVFYTVSGLWEKGEVQKVKSYLQYSTKIFLCLAIPAIVGLSMLSQRLLSVLTTSEFLSGELLIFFLGVGVIFSGVYQINVYVVYLVKETGRLPLVIALAAIINVGLNLVLIPQIGIIGAAVSSMVSHFTLATIVTVWAQKAIGITIDSKLLVKVVAGSVVMALALYFIRVDGIFGIILAIVTGATIFGTALFLMRAFSDRERRLMKETIAGLVPRLN
ncbi:MAG: polysaccharide biosynthesis C-terminal domain-containing protein [Dehalococcoidales bacterium]|nr:polysaccharide biosynthesis C-terminal domain-containing protein [Dehalococcoidales bacterium]